MRRAALALTLLSTPVAADCVRDADPCEIATGTYRIALPDNADIPVPAILFLHGFGGTGNGTLGMTATVEAITARGYAMIAPDGTEMDGRGGRRWSFLSARPADRDEPAFLADVVTDAASRHGIDPDRVLLAGFSAGGFMVTYLACAAPEAFPAYAPISGGFWRPHPDECAGPVKLLQTHGFRDSTVPLEGRPLRGGDFVQGDIFEGLSIWRDANGCAWDDPDAYSQSGQFDRRRWDCVEGSALEFALFPGGHRVPEGWADMAIDWFEAVTAD
ncbi:alpha/beta hydrolase family esterase [Jannaschia aquimarina]|uniref:Phospholipase/Carboxylesterase n=1 Tax=Jannaschia aquimarina TaxID=935700 RepID=A0A0D1EDN2_9RHOB|nr:PHB depolymerase family esterase [Jannaschia aquimarina]KIT15799.1 Phospholipase/Carboxylesterase [Jannaschia aquimarina]SNT42880.1 polyhydroxybutyrate depolymerase [Jannaschia aquimarina]